MAKNEGLVELRNRYGQAKIEAEMEGSTLPPMDEWIKLQADTEKQNNAEIQKGYLAADKRMKG